jgi:anti-anti-sigma factor
MAASATLQVAGDAATIVAAGEFDLATADTLAAALEGACAAGLSVVVDLSGVTFIDAWSMRALDQARRRLRRSGHELVVIHPQPLVRSVLEIGGFADVVRT